MPSSNAQSKSLEEAKNEQSIPQSVTKLEEYDEKGITLNLSPHIPEVSLPGKLE